MKKTYYVTFNKGGCRVICRENIWRRMAVYKKEDGRYYIFDYLGYKLLGANFALLASAIVYAWDVLKQKDKQKEGA